MLTVVASIAFALTPATYEDHKVEGWTLRVEKSLIKDDPALWSAVRQEAYRQLGSIVRVVSDEPLSKLRQVIVWVHKNSPGNICMAYHPGAQWLRDNKMNPDMAGHVEIGNAKNFVSWTYEQPWMLMHEMAHAYHFRFLKEAENNPDVLQAFRKATDSKIYESVRHWDGKMARHYALNNQMEYFAETSEAYFGTNDFFPFVHAELTNFDPEGAALMERVWGKKQKRIPN